MTSNNEIEVNAFLPPDQLFLNEPVGMRSIALECLARDLHKLFESKKEEIVRTLITTYKISRVEAYPRMLYYFEKVRTSYADESERLVKPLREILAQAMEQEKTGDLNKAIQLFEELSDNAFPPSLPYDRLRIIYTKQGFYKEAMRICQRYVEVLNMIKSFWPEYPNIRAIPKYQDHIKKLSEKLNQ